MMAHRLRPRTSKFSWDRAADAGTVLVNPHRDYWAPVKSIDVTDDLTVRSHSARYSDNWLVPAWPAVRPCVVSSKSVATKQDASNRHGAVQVRQLDRGASLTLTRNDGYWGNKARLTDVEFSVHYRRQCLEPTR